MSLIRLFMLSSLADLGPTHGHHIRRETEAKLVSTWTDVSVGAVYGAIGRLAAEGLLREVRRETEGNRPPRILYAITDAGRAVLTTLKRDMLDAVWFRYDPFDLALTTADRADRPALRATINGRIVTVNHMIAERETIIDDALKRIDAIDEWALRHSSYRLNAELRYLTDLRDWLDHNPET